MPQLHRRTNPLLRIVRGKPYASSDDHEPYEGELGTRMKDGNRKSRPTRGQLEKSIPTPPGTNSSVESSSAPQEPIDLTEDDVNADPRSDAELTSDDSVTENAEAKERVKKSPARESQGGGIKPSGNKTPAGEFTILASQESNGSKRSIASEEPDFMEAFERDNKLKKQKREQRAATYTNVHAVQPTRKLQKAGYGKTAQRSKNPIGFKKHDAQPPTIQSPSRKTSFKPPKGLDLLEDVAASYKPPRALDKIEDAPPPFKMPGHSFNDDPQQPQSGESEVTPLNDEEATSDPIDLISPTKGHEISDDITTECAYCGERVDKLLKEEYEDTYNNHGRGTTFRWKRRFCEYHKQKRAETLWQERNYPDIDWSGLEKRMRKHDAFLVDIIEDKKPSHYREMLKEKLKPRRRNFERVFDDVQAGRQGATVGYYGPRGEKIMVDHIVTSMSGELRRQATKDKLVASSSIRGGVSGFVQSVLAPHLAELLVKEDMNISGKNALDQARSIIAESAEVGELMNPEAEDKFVQEDVDDEDA